LFFSQGQLEQGLKLGRVQREVSYFRCQIRLHGIPERGQVFARMRPLPLLVCQEFLQSLWLHGLDQVVIEASLLGPAAVLLLTPPSQRHEQSLL
jgi:hypothetical protein